jgi:hypothetical protein
MSENETKSHTGSLEKGSTGSGSGHDVAVRDAQEIDLLAYHEHNAGRLVVDPECVWFFVLQLPC